MKCKGSRHLGVAMKTAAPLMHGLLLILLALSALCFGDCLAAISLVSDISFV